MGSSSKNVKQELDRISNLPEPIRCQIISMLPIEELVRTSVLSKRWQHSWKQVPNLNFDLTQMTKACRELFLPIRQFGLSSSDLNSKMLTKHLCSAARLVNTILNCHLAPVTSCRIFQFPIGFQDPIQSVEYLIWRNGIQEISLSGLYLGLDSYRKKNPPPLPSWGKTLQVLELSNYPLNDVSIFRGCDSLHTLRLKFVELGNETLDEILANCKDLKELSLSSCTGVINLMIRDTNLKILELRKLDLHKINIHAESLAVLILDNIQPPFGSHFFTIKMKNMTIINHIQPSYLTLHLLWEAHNSYIFHSHFTKNVYQTGPQCPANCLIIEAPEVGKFESFCAIEGETIRYRRLRDCIEMEELFSRCSGILGSCNNVGHALSTQTCYITPFKKLQMLSASLDLNNIREAIILSYFFQECSGLQNLRICSPVSVEDIVKLNQDSGNHLSYPDYLFWDRKETFFSIEKNLSAVWMRRFGGRELEMEFAKYIITRAPKMKSMIIECIDNCATDALSLLNLPRASMDLSLVLKHPSLSSGTSGCEWTCPFYIQWGHLEHHHDGFEKWPSTS